MVVLLKCLLLASEVQSSLYLGQHNKGCYLGLSLHLPSQYLKYKHTVEFGKPLIISVLICLKKSRMVTIRHV